MLKCNEKFVTLFLYFFLYKIAKYYLMLYGAIICICDVSLN